MNILSYYSRPGSVFVSQLNDFFGRVNEAGLLAIYKSWCRRAMEMMDMPKEGNHPHLITFKAIGPLFWLFICLMCASVIVFLLELVVAWVRKL